MLEGRSDGTDDRAGSSREVLLAGRGGRGAAARRRRSRSPTAWRCRRVREGRATVRSCSSDVSTKVPASSSQKSRIAVLDQPPGEQQRLGIAERGVSLEQPVRDGEVILGERRRPAAAVADRAPQAVAVAHEVALDEGDERAGRGPVRLVTEHERAVGEGAERQPVPGRDLLLVARRAGPLRPVRRAGPRARARRARHPDPPGDVDDVRPLPVAALGHAPEVGQRAAVGIGEARIGERRHELVAGPGVEASLHALAVGVQRRGESAVVGAAARRGGSRASRARRARIGPRRWPGRPRGRRAPAARCRRASSRSAARASARRCCSARSRRRAGRRCRRPPWRRACASPSASVAVVAGAAPGAQQELEDHRRRELRRAPEAAVRGVERRRQPGDGRVELARLDVARAGRHRRAAPGDGRPARSPAASTSARRVRYASATASRMRGKPGMPCRSSGGKYVPPKNGARSGVRKTRHRPAAGAGHRLHGGHVDVVEVGALLAVDLDRHEVLVHAARRSPRSRTTRAP